MDKIIDISDYQIIERINSGGFGSVYLVKEKKTPKTYAAKVIFKPLKTLEREIDIMMRINHCTTIKFYGYSKTDFHGENNFTIIMEFMKRGSLSSLLQEVGQGLAPHDYDNTTRQKILIGISCGMMHLHANKIIHRDLKPENILIGENYEPHISDFGLSKFVDKGQSSNQTPCVGTPIYMAPEVIDSENYTFLADVYSFGMLMFEVVTDDVPFKDFQNKKINQFNFFNKVVYEKYRPKFEIPVKPSIKELIEKCWSHNPKDRPSFNEIFEKLAKNKDFYLDGVDEDEIEIYYDKIAEKPLKQVKETQNPKKTNMTSRKPTMIDARYNSTCIDLKVVILGNSNSDKTSIINWYCNKGFRPDSVSTIGAGFFTHSIRIEDTEVTVMLWDTAGEERFRSVAPSLLRGSNGMVLVFDVTDKSSFDVLEYYLQTFCDNVDVSLMPVLPVLLLGNKIDLGECQFVDEVYQFKEKFNIKHFKFVSSKTGENIDSAFDGFIRDLIKSPDDLDPARLIINKDEMPKGPC